MVTKTGTKSKRSPIKRDNSKTATAKRANTTKKVEETNKNVVTQKVIINRELKYIYPKDCTTPLDRKAYRRKVRDHIKSLNAKIGKARGQAKAKLQADLKKYEDKVLTGN